MIYNQLYNVYWLALSNLDSKKLSRETFLKGDKSSFIVTVDLPCMLSERRTIEPVIDRRSSRAEVCIDFSAQ